MLSPETDHYNGLNGIKPGVSNRLNNVLHWVFQCTAINQYVFWILAAQSNKYEQRDMIGSKSASYLGH